MIRALLSAAVLFIGTAAYAQTGTAEIRGRVATVDGAVVERAVVTVTDIDTDVSRETHTNGGGRFVLPALPAGRYEVTATHDGFAGRRQQDIVLVPGQRLQIDLELRRAPLPETIALNPYPPILESARTHVASIIGEPEIEHLPIIGRRYLLLAEQAPAVTQDPVTGGLNVMDLPSAQNRVVIDGLDATNSLTGEPIGGDGALRSPYQVSLAAMDSFRVETNAAPADNGRGAGGVFNVVTRSGSNAFHGSGYEFFGDRALNGDLSLDENAARERPEYTNHQFGGTVGGPLFRRHDFFFLNYDGLHRNDRDQHLLLGRTDHSHAGQHLMLRVIDQRYDSDTPALEPTSLLRNRSGAATLGSAIGSFLVNEARAQYAENRDENPSGGSLFGSHRFDTTRVQAGDTVSLVVGGHSVKVGGDVIRDRHSAAFAPLSPVRADVEQYGAFAQDAWQPGDAVTVDLGLRYDVQDFNGLIATDRNNWAPRVGLAFAPGARRHVFRASYGLFYGSTPALIPALAQAFGAVVVDAPFTTARVHQASAGWEIEHYRTGTFGVDYLFARGDHLPRAVDVNVGRSAAPAARRVVAFESAGESIYNGVTLHMRVRMLTQMFFRAAYTLARSDDTPMEPVAMIFGNGADRRSLAQQGTVLDARAPGNNDQHQQMAVALTFDTTVAAANRHGIAKSILKDWEYSLVYTWQTGRPFSAFVNGDLNGDFNASNDIAPGTIRNQYRMPYQNSFDPRIARRVGLGGSRELSLIWEAFNVTNRPNYTAVDDTLYFLNGSTLVRNPRFGSQVAQLNGRMMQLAARISF